MKKHILLTIISFYSIIPLYGIIDESILEKYGLRVLILSQADQLDPSILNRIAYWAKEPLTHENKQFLLSHKQLKQKTNSNSINTLRQLLHFDDNEHDSYLISGPMFNLKPNSPLLRGLSFRNDEHISYFPSSPAPKTSSFNPNPNSPLWRGLNFRNDEFISYFPPSPAPKTSFLKPNAQLSKLNELRTRVSRLSTQVSNKQLEVTLEKLDNNQLTPEETWLLKRFSDAKGSSAQMNQAQKNKLISMGFKI